MKIDTSFIHYLVRQQTHIPYNHKTELPASSGLMAGGVFRQIVDIMNER